MIVLSSSLGYIFPLLDLETFLTLTFISSYYTSSTYWKAKVRSNRSTSYPLSSQPQQQKRILVIDDNPDIVFTLRVGLESDPTMQVFGYDNPVTALVEFEPNFYDLLLIDVNMPLMDGFQLAQNLVRRDLNVRVCFMTSGEINMKAAREVHPLKSIGCFIKKPITTDALVQRIKAELE